VPFGVVLSAVEHVVTLEKAIHRAEDDRTQHDVERRRPAFGQQGKHKGPAEQQRVCEQTVAAKVIFFLSADDM